MKQLQRSEWVVLVVVAAAVLVGGIAPTVEPTALATAVAYDGAALAVSCFALVGALRLPRDRRDEWLLIAAGTFCFFAGDVVWDFYERVLHQAAPLPSLADLIYLTAYPLMALGVLRLVRRRTDVDSFNASLDVGVLAMAVGLLVWEPLLVGSGRSLLGSLIAGAYPVFDIVLVGFCAALVGRRRGSQSTQLILGGAGVLFIADLTYLVLESRGTYATGGFPDPLFVIGTFLLAAAPWFDREEDPSGTQQLRPSRPLASISIIVAALTALPIDFGLAPEDSQTQETHIVRLALRILLLVFVAARLLRQASRNEALVTDLDRLSTRLATVVENTADAVVFVSTTGEILEWNAQAERLFGITHDEAVGREVISLFETETAIETAQMIMRSLQPGESIDVTLDLAPRGQQLAIALQVTAVATGRGGVGGFVAVARDDTRRVLSGHAAQSFAQLRPSDALTQFADELKAYVPFDTLSLASVEDNRFVELARVVSESEGRDRVLRATPPEDLLHGPLHESLQTISDQPYVILTDDDYGEFRGVVAAAGLNETIVVPLRDQMTGEMHGLLGLGFTESGQARKVVAESLVQIAPELSRSVANMRIYARERQTAERLQELDDLREGFFALVAHEVRSPLGAIGTAASVLRDHGADMDANEAREMAAGITDSARRLARLTGDLVDASRGGGGTFPCEMKPIEDFGTIATAAAHAAAGGDDARVRVCAESGLHMRGDADRLAQIVTNLVTNALKFSPASVEVTVARRGNEAELRVVDHGPGVPAAHAHRLFHRYARLPYDGPGVRPSGSGLGLFITRELALAHDGDLTHQPTPGGGATFVLRIPLT